MSVIDARALEDGARLQADVCIVGAGAAGITLALQLAAAGLQVLLVESGDLQPDEEIQALYDLDSVGYPPRANYMARARCFGGSCNLWAGRCMPLQSIDLVARTWVPGSGWPILLGDIERYYPRAASVLGLPSLGNFSAPSHAGRLTETERTLLAARDLAPAVSLWAPQPKRFGRRERRRIEQAQAITLLLQASVVSIDLDEAGQVVRTLTARTLSGSVLQCAARVFVLAAGGLETPRLLLVSRSRHAAGIGNRFDLVGRYFMEHPRTAFGVVQIEAGRRLALMRGWPLRDGKLQIGIGATPEAQEREGLLNHYLTLEEESSGYAQQHYQAAIEVGKVLLRRGHVGGRFELGRARSAPVIKDFIYLLSPKEILPHRVWRLATLARQRLAPTRGSKRYILVYFCEQPPDPASRVTLGTATDRLGLNRLVLDWRIADSVTASLLRLQDLFGRTVQQAGLGTLTPGSGTPHYTDASHHMGTTRMGTARGPA